jgi:hypothetical protein
MTAKVVSTPGHYCACLLWWHEPRLTCGCRAVACGLAHTVCLTAKDVLAWGSNTYGQLGHGDSSAEIVALPQAIKKLHDIPVTQVRPIPPHTHAGEQHATRGGKHAASLPPIRASWPTLCCGGGIAGQLPSCSHRSNKRQTFPRPVTRASVHRHVALCVAGTALAWLASLALPAPVGGLASASSATCLLRGTHLPLGRLCKCARVCSESPAGLPRNSLHPPLHAASLQHSAATPPRGRGST